MYNNMYKRNEQKWSNLKKDIIKTRKMLKRKIEFYKLIIYMHKIKIV